MSGYRIWKTKDGRYVGDCHVDAVELVAGPADRQPDDFDPATFEQANGVLGIPTPVEPVEEVEVVEEEPSGDEPGEQLEEQGVDPSTEKSEGDAEPEKPVDMAPTAKKAAAKKAAAKKAAAKKAAAKKAAAAAAPSAQK